jgi:hypothetical protein
MWHASAAGLLFAAALVSLGESDVIAAAEVTLRHG